MAINENSIRERAHWLWKQAGSPEGRDTEFWLEAERSLMDDPSQGEVQQRPGDEGTRNPDNFSPTPWANAKPE
jgi:hypothetical protein